MTEDFVTSIERLLEDRIEKLHDAAEEHDRLQAELSTLDAAPVALDAAPNDVAPPPLDAAPEVATPVTLDAAPNDAAPGALEIDPGQLEIDLSPSTVDPGPSEADPGPLTVDPTPDANVVRLPVRPEPARPPAQEPARPPARPPAVSPKVARLMLAPRRPALERSGIARVSGRDASQREAVDESEAQTEIYKRAV